MEDKDQTQNGNLVKLPQEVLLSILQWLSVSELGAMASTCQLFQKLTSDDFVWKKKLIEHGKEVPTIRLFMKEVFKSHFQQLPDNLDLVLLGEASAKKTVISARFAKDPSKPNSSLCRIIGIDFTAKNVEIGNKAWKIRVWGTAGQEHYTQMLNNICKRAHAILICVNLASEKIAEETRKHYQIAIKLMKAGCEIALLGVHDHDALPTEESKSALSHVAHELKLDHFVVDLLDAKEIQNKLTGVIKTVIDNSSPKKESDVAIMEKEPEKRCLLM